MGSVALTLLCGDRTRQEWQLKVAMREDIPCQKKRPGRLGRGLQGLKRHKAAGVRADPARLADGNRSDLIFVAVADDGINSGQRGDFFRRALRIAAGHHDAGPGVGPPHPANVGACIAVGFRGYRAGVHHHHIGLL